MFLAFAGVAALFGSTMAIRPFHAACAVADRYMATATDGPWVLDKARLVIDWNLDDSPGMLTPHWIFRFQNPRNGTESKRVYATFSGDEAFSYRYLLDPLPVLGFRP
jgi:hypothetical protein